MASTSDEQPVSANVTADVQSPPSDNDSGERPVRQQLKETSIESKPQPANDSNGSRKRSFDESREDDDGPTDNGENRKKRSRESTPENTDNDKTSSGEANASAKTGNASEATDQVTENPEPEKKRPRDNSTEPETQTKNGFAGSAFAKAVGASPFDVLGNAAKSAGDSAEKTTASAFASSHLAGFAGSEKSPFGSLGATTPSVFKPAASSGFGSLGSGFSGVGGGFSAAAKSGGLRSFASNTAPALGSIPATQPAETQDAEADETETSENPEKENASTFKAEKTDDRFYAQEMSTGEEDEENIFTCKAKLFNFTDGEWRERGIGTFKVNVRKEDGRRRGRMIMRADGALRVMLNSPIFEGMKYGDQEGKAPSTKQLFIASMDEGKIVSCLLRTGKAEIATELYEKIHGLLADEDEDEGEGEREEDGEEDGK